MLVILANSIYCMSKVAQRPALNFGTMWIKKGKKKYQKPFPEKAWVQTVCISRPFVPMGTRATSRGLTNVVRRYEEHPQTSTKIMIFESESLWP